MKTAQLLSLGFMVGSVMALNAATPPAVSEAGPAVTAAALPWQPLSPQLSFTLILERERYTTLDRSARLVLAVEAGKGGPSLDALAVTWAVRGGDRVIVQRQDKIEQGLLAVDVDLGSLKPGRYDVTARLMSRDQELTNQASFFRLEQVAAPPQAGRIALVLPDGQPLKEGTFPMQAGVPFPKGALWSTEHVRLVDAQGNAVPCGLTVRGRWGSGEASIRWLGVDFQAEPADAWWPKREMPQYFLEFGPTISSAAAPVKVTAADQPEGIAVDAGAISFLVRRQGFNLIDEVKVGGQALLKSDATQGLYLIDHEGATYRAANDDHVKLTIEEQNDLRVVVRAEGWYVKDGTTGQQQDFKLPTDKLCKFITRIEAYAGKPYVRVLSTWINTFDTFSVRLRDMGLTLPHAAQEATFGVEGRESVVAQVPAGGVRLVQHLENQFVVEDGAGKPLATGARSAGWVVARGTAARVAISHRNTWQRFPKEFEVRGPGTGGEGQGSADASTLHLPPSSVILHIWPAHGKDHPGINPEAKDQIHRMWFAHQGREMNMAMPWGAFFAVSGYSASNYGGADADEQALTGVGANAMGTAVTSDLLIHFAAADTASALADTARCFQTAPHALADPQWSCDSLAMGYLHPYDPENFRGFEETISDCMRGYWNSQEHGNMFGMWIYRSWQHSNYNGDGSWSHYRLFNGTHHNEAMIPWMLYARSGDPFFLTQGRANIRQLSDVQIIHYADRAFAGVADKQVGATQHDNCVVPWGGDAHIFGHQHNYLGLMLGYYLTGDLRLREVLVDEYQNTIVANRADPSSRYDISHSADGQGRDNSNPVSDLLDLYQFTYDARVLAVLAPKLDVWLYGVKSVGGSSLFSFWGQPLQGMVLFQGRADVRQSLLDIMAKKRSGKISKIGTKQERYAADAAGEKEGWSGSGAFRGWTNLLGRARQPGHVWDTAYFVTDDYAMATILDPQSPYAADLMADLGQWGAARDKARALMRIESMPFTWSADAIRFMPRLMYALMHSSRRDLAGLLGDARPMPGTYKTNPLRIIVREDTDQAINVHFIGTVNRTNGLDVQAFGPDGALISRTTVPPGRHTPFVITLPEDGKTGQYVVFVNREIQHGFVLTLPVTTLPEVVSLDKEWGTTEASGPTMYFTRSAGAETCELSLAGEGTRLYAADKQKVLGFTDKTKPTATIQVGPEGAWLGKGVGNSNGAPLIVSTTPERWFAPDPAALEIQPVP